MKRKLSFNLVLPAGIILSLTFPFELQLLANYQQKYRWYF